MGEIPTLRKMWRKEEEWKIIVWVLVFLSYNYSRMM
jgi:hypothetical protein